MTFGQRLKKLREEKDISREELAQRLGISYWTLSKYETDSRSPDHETIVTIAEHLNVTTDYLLGRTNQRNPQNQNPALNNPALKEIESLSDESLKELENYIRLLKIKDEMDKGKNETSSTLEKNA